MPVQRFRRLIDEERESSYRSDFLSRKLIAPGINGPALKEA